MYSNLILYRNELKNKSIYKYKLIGIVSELIYSKKIFKKNIDISDFVEKIFGIELKDYVLKSRSSIVSKISKFIFDDEEKNLKYIKRLYEFINYKIEIMKKEEKIVDKKNDFDGWIK